MSNLKMKYFVVSPNKNDIYGQASREAIRAYANSISEEDIEFANELYNWVFDIESSLNDEVPQIYINKNRR